MHMQPFEEAAFLAFSQHESGLSKEAASRKQAKELSIAVRCVSLVGECLGPLPCPAVCLCKSSSSVACPLQSCHCVHCTQLTDTDKVWIAAEVKTLRQAACMSCLMKSTVPRLPVSKLFRNFASAI